MAKEIFILVHPGDDSGNDDGELGRAEITQEEANAKNEELVEKKSSRRWVRLFRKKQDHTYNTNYSLDPDERYCP